MQIKLNSVTQIRAKSFTFYLLILFEIVPDSQIKHGFPQISQIKRIFTINLSKKIRENL